MNEYHYIETFNCHIHIAIIAIVLTDEIILFVIFQFWVVYFSFFSNYFKTTERQIKLRTSVLMVILIFINYSKKSYTH